MLLALEMEIVGRIYWLIHVCMNIKTMNFNKSAMVEV